MHDRKYISILWLALVTVSLAFPSGQRASAAEPMAKEDVRLLVVANGTEFIEIKATDSGVQWTATKPRNESTSGKVEYRDVQLTELFERIGKLADDKYERTDGGTYSLVLLDARGLQGTHLLSHKQYVALYEDKLTHAVFADIAKAQFYFKPNAMLYMVHGPASLENRQVTRPLTPPSGRSELPRSNEPRPLPRSTLKPQPR